MRKKKYLLPNRYGHKVWLVKESANAYRIQPEEDWINFYVTGSNPIKFIDWDGGDPFGPGSVVEEGYVVTSITFDDGDGPLIKFEKIKKDETKQE